MTREEACERLEKLDVRNSSVEEVRSLFETVEYIPVITATLKTGTCIHRTRMGRGYYAPRELSYKNPRFCTSMQRASLPYESVFYGCLADDQSHLENGRALGLMECSKLVRDMEGFGREYVTASVWEVLSPIHVVSFITDQTYKGVKNLSEQVKNFIRLYRDKYKNVGDVERRAGRVIDREFCKDVEDNRDYLITATLVHDMLYDFGKDFDAVVYPSVKAMGDLGLNVAIKPIVADQKLRLWRVIDQTHFRNRDKTLVWIDKGYDINHHLINKDPITDSVLYEKTGIRKVQDFPIFMHK